MVTFKRPITAEERGVFARSDAQLVAIEAISHRGSHIITVGGPAERGAPQRLKELAAADHAVFDGVVAAEVVIPTQTAYLAAEADPRAYLVDVSVEMVRRWAGPGHEVGLNDLYSTLGGLN